MFSVREGVDPNLVAWRHRQVEGDRQGTLENFYLIFKRVF